MKMLRDRRNLILGGVAGAALLGAVALGIGYFVVFAGSSPQKLALSSPTATPSSTASSDSTPSAAAGTWTVTAIPRQPSSSATPSPCPPTLGTVRPFESLPPAS